MTSLRYEYHRRTLGARVLNLKQHWRHWRHWRKSPSSNWTRGRIYFSPGGEKRRNQTGSYIGREEWAKKSEVLLLVFPFFLGRLLRVRVLSDESSIKRSKSTKERPPPVTTGGTVPLILDIRQPESNIYVSLFVSAIRVRTAG